MEIQLTAVLLLLLVVVIVVRGQLYYIKDVRALLHYRVCKTSIARFHSLEGKMRLDANEAAHYSLSSAASPKPGRAVPRAPIPPPVPCSRPWSNSIHLGTWLLA